MIDQADRHIYLYAKGHYKHTDTIKDLQQIFSARNGIDSEYIRTKDMARVLLSIVYPHIESKHQFIEFILALHPNEFWKCWLESPKQHDFFEAVIGKCMSILAMTTVFDIESGKTIMNLGEPDPTILPLKREEVNKTKNE